jgi:hypothetical protein
MQVTMQCRPEIPSASGRKRGMDHARKLDLAISFRKQHDVGIETAFINQDSSRIARRKRYFQ